MIDPRGYATSFSYDAAGRKRTETDPLGRVTTFSYDAVGNLARRVNARGQVVTYTYSANRELTGEQYPAGRRQTYTYDDAGNRTRIADATGVTTLAYDTRNLLESLTNPDGQTVTYRYNALRQRTGMGVRLISPQHVLHFLEQVGLHDRRMFARIRLVLVDDLADVLAIGQVFVGGAPFPWLAAKVLSCLCAIPLGDDALSVQGLGHLAAGVQFQKQLEHPPHQLGLGAIDDVSLVDDVQAKYRLPADVFAQTCRRELLVADPFADDLALELRKRQQNVQRDPRQ